MAQFMSACAWSHNVLIPSSTLCTSCRKYRPS